MIDSKVIASECHRRFS